MSHDPTLSPPRPATLAEALAALRRAVEDHGELAGPMEVLDEHLACTHVSVPRVIWQRDCSRGRYRIVARTKIGDTHPSKFIVERGHVDACGNWSWNRTGETPPRGVFSAVMAQFYKLIEAHGPPAADPLAHTSADVTRQHAGEMKGGAA